MRRFNVTGLCVPDEDYMVDISGKVAQIRKMVDDRCYFTINRARQYGKTTTLLWMSNDLASDYLVASISFEGLDDESFDSPEAFCQVFLNLVHRALEFTEASNEYREAWLDSNIVTFPGLSNHITKMCKPSKEHSNQRIVLMIDEVDKTSNNRTFLHFLGVLRDKFLARKSMRDYTFHSVILAGVYDIRNIKLKMINEGVYQPSQDENKLYNSPWNIAAAFTVDMSFSPAEIATMLAEYETDHNTGMDISEISEEIFSFTGGYPFLVSMICRIIDKKLGKDWTLSGVQDAVKILLAERNTLFDDVFENLEKDRELYDFIHGLLIMGETKHFVIHNPIIATGVRYGFFSSREGRVAFSNRIFELLMTDYFMR